MKTNSCVLFPVQWLRVVIILAAMPLMAFNCPSSSQLFSLREIPRIPDRQVQFVDASVFPTGGASPAGTLGFQGTMLLPAGSIDGAVLPATLRIILWYADGGGTFYETREFPLAVDTTTGDIPNQNFAFGAQSIPPGGAIVVAVRPEGAAIGPNGLTLGWNLTTE